MMVPQRSNTLVDKVVNGDGRDRVEIIRIDAGAGARRTLVDRIVANIKSLAVMFTSQSWISFGNNNYGQTSRDGTVDYRERIGNGRNNSIVLACLELMATTFAQSPVQVMLKKDDSSEIVPDHELIGLLDTPNPFYSGKLLWSATIIDWMFGNAYWVKVRSTAGKPVQLYWVPSTMMRPVWPESDPTVFISHYEYVPNGRPIRYEVNDVVHFRNGLDPQNMRQGLSRLGALLREISTDEEAGEYVNTILRRLGVAGMVISPAGEKIKLSQKDADEIKARIIHYTTGDNRGDPLVLGAAVKVEAVGADPSKLDTAAIRHVPEERITSIFGTPAVIVGLGTGLQNATYSNVDGLRKIFYENKVIPTQELIGNDIRNQLLRDFEVKPNQFIVEFDNSKVRVLKPDEDKLTERIDRELKNGSLTLNEARALRDRKPLPEDALMLDSRIVPTDIQKVLEPDVEVQPVVADDTVPAISDDNNNIDDKGTGAHDTQYYTKDIGNSIVRIRSRMHTQCKRDTYAYLLVQKRMVLDQIAGQKGAGAKAWRINWPRVQEDYDALKGVLEPWYKRTLVAVHDVVQDTLGTSYELGSGSERTYLKSAALNIRGINDATRMAVQEAVAMAIDLDEDAEELAERISELGVFSEDRAALIAETELAQASNLAQIESYRESEVVVGVLVTDGDSDEGCRLMNGTRVAIREARSIPPLGHPHCARQFTHLMSMAELEGAA